MHFPIHFTRRAHEYPVTLMKQFEMSILLFITLGIFFLLILKLRVAFHLTVCPRVCVAVVTVGQRGLSPWYSVASTTTWEDFPRGGRLSDFTRRSLGGEATSITHHVTTH